MNSLKELTIIKETALEELNFITNNKNKIRIVVGLATCGIAAGAESIFKEFQKELNSKGLKEIIVAKTGCIGVCPYEPMVEVHVPGEEKVTYVNLTKDKVSEIIEKHIIGGEIIAEYAIGENIPNKKDISITSLGKTDFYKRQFRIGLRNCGIINPENINEYIAHDGYLALGKAITGMKSEDIIDIIKKSGLRGRGGGGFPTGLKWEFARKAISDKKYIICNADEGDPGAFMDRSILEGDPHSVIEAMAIVGYAIGSSEGFIYIRAEYPTAVKRLGIAIEQAKEKGLLGENILGSGFGFDIEIRLGAGAFVCGEETALITSIEGHRGEPFTKPPFPAEKGLWGQSTVINNVETLALIPIILLKGANWFSSIGTEKSTGTKVFALGGKIENTGLVEIPMGTTLREIIEDIGGGIPNGKTFKAAQTGGPSGGCIPAKLFDIPIDYDSLASIGSMMGSGGLIVMDEDTCMVDIAKFFLDFTVDESCGKCVPCRIGTKKMHGILEKITSGKGSIEDIEMLEKLGKAVKDSSLCGLGQTAPNPVLSTIRYFKEEYLEHINEKKCRAGVCKALLNYVIDDVKCKGCAICERECPVNAITGEIKEIYIIDNEKCTKCGICFLKCPFDAIIRK
jgi:NADH:ubiquinone oxidoreductase subunit F (NADH-binding)/(2Fe-2S) ferredoxin/NAD-dependent dihydropyrimidine dehydrogenase PreA subunit